jgi:hypothetical protein
MKSLFSFFIAALFTVPAFGSTLMEKYEMFKNRGIPSPALLRALEFAYRNDGKSVPLKAKARDKEGVPMVDTTVKVKTDYMAIIDYSRPSTEKRLYLLNLTSGQITRYYVAHGKNSGVRYTTNFANVNDSKKSSLGLAIAGPTYRGFHGYSLNLYGVEPSNDQMSFRDVVMHGASYVSDKFIADNGRLGRSWGCAAVEEDAAQGIIDALQNGSVIYFYHSELMKQASLTPSMQDLKNSDINDDEDRDLPGEEEDLQNQAKERARARAEARAKAKKSR